MPDVQMQNHTNVDVFISSKSMHKLKKKKKELEKGMKNCQPEEMTSAY